MNKKLMNLIAVGSSVLLVSMMSTPLVAQQLGAGGIRSLEAGQPLVIGSFEDSLQYAGEQVRPLEGGASVQVDALRDEGAVIIELKTTELSGPLHVAEDLFLEGDIRLVMDTFVGSQPFMAGGIAQELRVHGDTGRMSALLPELFAHLVGWGDLDVYVDGQLLYEGLDAHFMITDSVRRGLEGAYQIIRSRDETVYDPSLPDKTGFVYSQDLELHLWVAPPGAAIVDLGVPGFFLSLNLYVQAPPLEGVTASTPPMLEPPEEEPEEQGEKGNNGIGNGTDPQPPGNPPINDGEDSGRGNGRK